MTNVMWALLIKLLLITFLQTNSGLSVVFKKPTELMLVLHINVSAFVWGEVMLCHAKSTAAEHVPPHHVLLLSTS